MRADRLLAILLLLQARGRMTAAALASELEVSERTIYRDIDALSSAGVPVVGDAGPGGGYELLDRYRTQLTGLTADEVRALFMLSIPAPLARLGVADHLRTALFKLAAALPESRRDDERRVRQRFHLDATGWREAEDRVPHMQLLQEAVWHDRKLLVTVATPFAGDIASLVEPYGLVAKAGVWYVVYARRGALRATRAAAFTQVQDTLEPFERPAGFDLAAFWRDWCREHEAWLAGYTATVRVEAATLPVLARRPGVRFHEEAAGEPDALGRRTLCLSFASFEEARDVLLGLGRGAEVLAPEALRLGVLDYAEQVVALYTAGG